ncbi:MAG: energy-coupling factor ABC transporter ATP-binding protein [Thermofilaceae archaeon]|nr:energy-coupling factor ABC transporter ATP-binding protein [Thermofilaceae archaeon]
MAAIEVRDLSFTYAGKSEPALRNVNLRIEWGETVLLAGRSGSGKSTLIKAINGLIPHRYEGEYKGEVLVGGLRVSEAKLSQISRRVGTVMQEVSKQVVLPTVVDDVAFGLCNQCMDATAIEESVDRALSRLGILHLKDRDVNELSGGEKQRVAIAGILAMDPQIVLLDEPMANLDSEGVRATQELIRNLREEGRTVVIAEHRVEEVCETGVDRILVMEGGRVVQEARDPRELKEFKDVLKLPASILLSEKNAPTRTSVHDAVPGEVAVEFRSVSFSYDGRLVLRDVDLQVREGERVALLGNNGAGKSTMAKLMLGLLKPSKGSVLIYGHDTRSREVYDIAPIVGLVFQDPFNMLFAKSVSEELAFGPINLGVPREEILVRVREAAEQCRVDHLLPFSPFASSHGEKKRICVASILTMKPRVLVLDEPTAGQDYASYTAFMGFIMNLIREGVVKTLVLITHDTDLALEYTDRTVVLADGEIVADGPTTKVLADPSVLARGRIRETSLIRMGRKISGGERVYRVRELGLAS